MPSFAVVVASVLAASSWKGTNSPSMVSVAAE
jgi:hypothetical protein